MTVPNQTDESLQKMNDAKFLLQAVKCAEETHRLNKLWVAFAREATRRGKMEELFTRVRAKNLD